MERQQARAVTLDFQIDANEALLVPYCRSISIFCFVPLLAMETMIPKPARITTPITIQVGSTFCRIPSFHSPARTPPISKANPKKYIPAHFMAHLLIRSAAPLGGRVPVAFLALRAGAADRRPSPGV